LIPVALQQAGTATTKEIWDAPGVTKQGASKAKAHQLMLMTSHMFLPAGLHIQKVTTATLPQLGRCYDSGSKRLRPGWVGLSRL